jgi:hypothetical protein
MCGAPLHDDVRFWRDEDLPGIEARFSSYTQKAFRTHTHRHCIVSLVEAGNTRFSLDRTLHSVRAGQIVVIEAGRPHACNPTPGAGIAYRLLALDTGWLMLGEALAPGQFAACGLILAGVLLGQSRTRAACTAQAQNAA